MANTKTNTVIHPKRLEKTVHKINAEYLQDFPKPQFFDQAGTAELDKLTPIVSTKEKFRRPFNVILPISNTIGSATEHVVGLGFSTPLSENTGIFAIASSNLNGASSIAFGGGYVPIHQRIGDFQANLGVSADVVCVENGSHPKHAPNPSIGSCGIYGSIYSSLVHISANEESIFNNIGFHASITPALSGNQDTVVTTGIFKRFNVWK